MKICFDSNIDTTYLRDVVAFIRTLEIKEGRLSQATFKSMDGEHVYNIWHNKKSFSVSYQLVERRK